MRISSTSQIKMISLIPRRIPTRPITLLITNLQLSLGDIPNNLLQLKRRLDERARETHGDMPFDVAVDEPDSRVVSPEPDARRAAALDLDGVALDGGGRDGSVAGLVGPGTARRAAENLEVMAVEVEWVVAGREVVEDDFDDLALFNYVGVDLAIDSGVRSVLADGEESVEGGYILVDVT